MVDGVQAGVVVQSAFNEAWARFSPDDRWIAYQSDESGQSEVYVRAFTAPGRATDSRPPDRQWQVSAGGGQVPVWAANGRELFYVRGDGMLMTVPITVRGATIEPQPPVALFAARVGRDPVATVPYDVTSDNRFLINTIVGGAAAVPITVIQHWTPPVLP